jgi:hypothetical protein
MDTTQADEAILKTDVLGRVKTPLARREELLDEFERSGLTGQKFAELVGVKYQTFATWAQKRRRARGAYPAKALARKADKVKWLEAVVEAAQPAIGKNALVLELPGGAKAEISDARQAALAADLLRALAGSC